MPIKQDDELDKLEEVIRVVKNKYDQFFSGIQKMPPWTERRAVEAFIQELHKQKMRDNTRRYLSGAPLKHVVRTPDGTLQGFGNPEAGNSQQTNT